MAVRLTSHQRCPYRGRRPTRGLPTYCEYPMSRSSQRRGRRCAIAVRNLIRARVKLEAFAAEVRRIAPTDVSVWWAAEAAAQKSGISLTDDERAVLALAVDPRRAPKTPGSVLQRLAALPKTRSHAVPPSQP